MKARIASAVAAVLLTSSATAAMAQDIPPLPAWHGPHGTPGPESDRPEWRGPPPAEVDSRPEWREPIPGPDGRPMRREMPRAIGGDHAMPGPVHGGMAPQAAPRFGYTPAQRAAWLDECRASQLPRERRSGGVLGGVLGAVAGGVAGNRIADGSRLLGTVVGGVGGAIAGAIIGDAIDRDGDTRREARALDFCEDYLARYEQGGMVQPGYGYGYGYPATGYAMAVPVMMVAMPMPQHRAVRVEEEAIDEWVEVPPVRRAHRVVHRPTPAPAKRVPVRGKLLPEK